MDVLLALLGAGTSGGLLGVGAAANARLKGSLRSPIAAAAMNFLVGFATLMLMMALMGVRLSGFGLWHTVPWWAFWGGLMGAAFVTLNTLTVPRLGLTTTTLAVVVSQLGTSMVIDQFGLLGVAAQPVSHARIVAIVFLVAAIALAQFDRSPASSPRP